MASLKKLLTNTPLPHVATLPQHIYIFIFILDFPSLLDLACHHHVSFSHPLPWIATTLS